MQATRRLSIYFPTIRTGTGSDKFTISLVDGLRERGVIAEICWLPHRAEYAPWSVCTPRISSNYDIVHINTWLPTRFVPNNLPVVATVHHGEHDPFFFRRKSLLKRLYHLLWIRRVEDRNARRAARLTAVSIYAKKTFFSSKYQENTDLIYNGVDTEVFIPKFSDKRERFSLLFVGTWSFRKGVDLLGPIMSQLGDKFFLKYTGSESAKLPRNCMNIGTLKSVADVVRAMQDCDALILPSRSEGFGLVAAEAMACGKPVIATNCTGLSEVVAHGETGFLCPVDDVDAFVEAARLLESDFSKYSEIGRSARNRSVNLFSRSFMLNRYIELYEKILNHDDRC